MPADFSAETWRRARDGDRDAFEEALAPYHDDLRAAGERLLDLHTSTGELGEQALTPEALVGGRSSEPGKPGAASTRTG